MGGILIYKVFLLCIKYNCCLKKALVKLLKLCAELDTYSWNIIST